MTALRRVVAVLLPIGLLAAPLIFPLTPTRGQVPAAPKLPLGPPQGGQPLVPRENEFSDNIRLPLDRQAKKRIDAAEDYMKAADDALEAAKVLAGAGGINDQAFLERMARSDELVDHDGETCGQCRNMILGAEVAREMIEAGEYEDVVIKWAAESKRRWEDDKFYKLWHEEKKAGRDPRKAFKDRGWEP